MSRWYKDRDFPEIKNYKREVVAVIENPKQLEKVIHEHNDLVEQFVQEKKLREEAKDEIFKLKADLLDARCAAAQRQDWWKDASNRERTAWDETNICRQKLIDVEKQLLSVREDLNYWQNKAVKWEAEASDAKWERHQLNMYVKALREAWGQSWDCSNDPDHSIMKKAISTLPTELVEILNAEQEAQGCNHPNCGCVCNHQSLCPECGPINGGKDYNLD